MPEEPSLPPVVEDDDDSDKNPIRWVVDNNFKANQQRLQIPQGSFENPQVFGLLYLNIEEASSASLYLNQIRILNIVANLNTFSVKGLCKCRSRESLV